MARVTIKTVADAAGVSPSTVSNAYNKPNQLSAKVRERILATAEELGYTGPNAAARSLRGGRANAVGVMITERLSYAFSDPYAVGFLTGLSETLEQHSVSIVLLPIGLDEEPDVTAMRQANIDALATLCVSQVHPAVKVAEGRDIHLVFTDVRPEPDHMFVAIDDEDAGYRVGRHIADLGHERVAVIVDTNRAAGDTPEFLTFDDLAVTPDTAARVRGIRRGLSEADLTLVSAGHNALASGHVAAAGILDGRDRPTAIIGLSDVLALGALEAMKQRGLRAPHDLSVAGFDDIPAAADAGLTTVRQPYVEKGRLVGGLLLDPEREERRITLPIELVVRSSTGPVRPG
jgi:DNA-binding LacI/PurR family transcriptional regulator